MRHLTKPSRLVLSVAMTALLASTSMLTACSGFQKQPPRYNTVMGPKRAPVLNPGGTDYAPPEMEAAEDAMMPMPAGMMNEMPPAPMPQQMMMAPAPMPGNDMPASGRKVPVGNQQAMAGEMAPTMPVEPVMAAELQSPNAPVVSEIPPAPLAMGVAPQPMESAPYQPMVNENGEFPTLQEVPPVPQGMEERAVSVRQEAADFASQSAQLPPLDETAMPASPVGAPPSYEEEMQASAPAVSPVPPQPAPTPLQQAGHSYTDYYEASQQASPPAYAPSEPVAASEPLPTYEPVETMEEAAYPAAPVEAMQPVPMETAENVYEEPAYDAEPSGLPPIQLRAPSSAAGGAYGGVRGSDVLPQSRYSGRTVYSRPGVMRH